MLFFHLRLLNTPDTYNHPFSDAHEKPSRRRKNHIKGFAPSRPSSSARHCPPLQSMAGTKPWSFLWLSPVRLLELSSFQALREREMGKWEEEKKEE